jgi:Activator of Hsp90 ATPase homolog 1-like protein
MSALPPVEQRIVVRLAPDDAFELFTRGLARWWPFKGHSCSGEDAQDVVFEARVGGTVTEVGADGARHSWGVLTAWDPPHGFAMTWHPGQDVARATQLAVRFSAVAGGCEVHLVHGGWDVLGDGAGAMRGNYDQGWGWVLSHYLQLAGQEATR